MAQLATSFADDVIIGSKGDSGDSSPRLADEMSSDESSNDSPSSSSDSPSGSGGDTDADAIPSVPLRASARGGRAKTNRHRWNDGNGSKVRGSIQGPIMPMPTVKRSDDPFRDFGVWTVELHNASSWTSARASAVVSTADVMLAPENEVDAKNVDAEAGAAKALGISASIFAARVTELGGLSAGCAVAAIGNIGMAEMELDLVTPELRDGIHVARIRTGAKGGFSAICAYLHRTEKLSNRILLLTAAIASVIAQLHAPWVIGADWNLPPELLRTTSFLDDVGAEIVYTSLPTCNDLVYVYFVVSSTLKHVVAGIQLVHNVGRLLRHLLRQGTRTALISKVAKATALPTRPPDHAANCPPCYTTVEPEIDVAEVNKLIKQWYRHAKTEFGGIAGADPAKRSRGDGPSFK